MSREPWDDWKDAWRDTPPVDIDRLRRHVDGERRRMRWFVVAEVLVSLLVLAHLAWRYVSLDGGSPWRVLILCGMGLVVGSQILMLALRRGAWRSRNAVPADLLRLTMRRCDIGMRLILAQWIGLVVCYLVTAAWLSLEWPVLAESMGRDRLAFALKINVVVHVTLVLGFAAWTAWYLPRLRHRHALARQLAADLDRE